MNLPTFQEGECAVLGMILLDWSVMDRVAQELTPTDFAHPFHRQVYEAAIRLYKTGNTLDYVTFQDAVRPSETDRMYAIEKLFDAQFSSANIDHYIGVLKDKRYSRDIIRAAKEAITLCSQNNGGTEKAVEILNKACLSRISNNSAGLEHIGVVARRELVAMDERIQNGTELGIMTGIDRLDSTTNGLMPGELSIIAARPSMGKSALAENIIMHVGKKHCVHLFSLEMNKTNLVQRFTSKATGISIRQLRSRHITDNQAAAVADATDELERLDFWLDDITGLTPFDVYTKSCALSSRIGRKADLIIVDHLHLMRPTEKQTSREREIGSCTTDLKSFAKRLQCHIMALAQLSRKPDARPLPERAPVLSDLRDSGGIEQDADLAVGLWRKYMYTYADTDTSHAELTVLKQRNGPIGRIPLAWEPEIASFRNVR